MNNYIMGGYPSALQHMMGRSSGNLNKDQSQAKTNNQWGRDVKQATQDYMQKANKGGAAKTSLFGSVDDMNTSNSNVNENTPDFKDANMSNTSILMDGSMSVNHSKDSIMMQSRDSKYYSFHSLLYRVLLNSLDLIPIKF